jgi:hypothetical protein
LPIKIHVYNTPRHLHVSRIKKRANSPKILWNPPKEIALFPLDIFPQQAYILLH